MRAPLSLFAILALALPTTAYADSYSYSFSASDNITFTYTSPVLITTDTSFTPTTCTLPSALEVCKTVEINPPAGTISFFYTFNNLTDGLEFEDLPASFFDVGANTYFTDSLTITDIPAGAATPEPDSLVLLGTGLLGIGGIMGWRTRRPGQ